METLATEDLFELAKMFCGEDARELASLVRGMSDVTASSYWREANSRALLRCHEAWIQAKRERVSVTKLILEAFHCLTVVWSSAVATC